MDLLICLHASPEHYECWSRTQASLPGPSLLVQLSQAFESMICVLTSCKKELATLKFMWCKYFFIFYFFFTAQSHLKFWSKLSTDFKLSSSRQSLWITTPSSSPYSSFFEFLTTLPCPLPERLKCITQISRTISSDNLLGLRVLRPRRSAKLGWPESDIFIMSWKRFKY